MNTTLPDLPSESWVGLLGADPRPWLLASDEPAARLIVLARLLNLPKNHLSVRETHAAVLADPTTQILIDRLPDWEADQHLSGHNSPGFAPNLLNLLADMGVSEGDDPRIEQLLSKMLAHQEENGRFPSYGTSRASPTPTWGALPCDAHAIAEVLVRFGRGDDPRVRQALARMIADLSNTAQGQGWLCISDTITGFRGPGRKADFCPQVTLEALRTFAYLPETERPPDLLPAARTLLRAWQFRSEEKPYMFGHGYQFKTVKWPSFWYSIYPVLDTLGRYPELWRSPEAQPSERKSLAELVACLVAYNFDPDGTVTPRSCYQGFEAYSFGQKKRPSAFATACLAVTLRRFNELTADIKAVDIFTLPSSKGGTGTPRPPKPRRSAAKS